MLRKLLKHDIVATSRYFIPMFVGLMIMSIVNKITFEMGIMVPTDSTFLQITSIMFLTLYILCIIAAYILCYVFITIHFYQTMSGEQGYLTHTLPVRTYTIINGKLITSFFWQMITTVLICLSLVLLAVGHVTWDDLRIFFNSLWLGIQTYEFPIVKFVIVLIFTFSFGLIGSTLMLYASIALGHLFKKHKVAWAVVFYVVIYIVMQIVSTILLIFSGYWTTINMQDTPYNFYDSYMNMLNYGNLMNLVFSLVFYGITAYVFTKKLNLD